jgi:valyl-tRNA synthetase
MALNKNYSPAQSEPALQSHWQEQCTYHFERDSERPVYSIDTPPPTVSGHLHLGHVYSYSHADFMARFYRMNGYNVFYPMGFDDNGLPTERLVEKRQGVTAQKIGRQAFIERCLQVSEEAERDYQALWQRLGLSIDWRYTYRTIDENSRRTSQLSFIDLHRKGRLYRQSAPAIWCPECRTSIAQADLNDLERDSEFVTLPFQLPDGTHLLIATTRPELLAACVAIFVHPEDARYRALIGQNALVPLYGQAVPILPDPAADPEKGTGAVMCCTFGDQTDVAWWFTHKLPLKEVIDHAGRMTPAAGPLAGLALDEARRKVKELLAEQGIILGRQPTRQSIRVHERCDTPVEYVLAAQWFISVLDRKAELLSIGEQVHWHPEPMRSRYTAWVENLNWDWCISRQRYFGVPFPVWYCNECGAPILAEEADLPVDPLSQSPSHPCACGSTAFTPESDVLDTWATSSLSPQICGHWLADPELFKKIYPFSLRPQAHEIIRTWAFYTITKSSYHLDSLPWKDVLISGWGLAGEGQGKISKSRGGGPMAPLAMIEKYSADALRYWAASTSPGKDSIISEDKIQMGTRLVTKLWNVARFAERFIIPSASESVLQDKEPNPLAPFPERKGEAREGAPISAAKAAEIGFPSGSPSLEGRGWGIGPSSAALSPADRWILARMQELIRQVTSAMQNYEYAMAKSEIETFFWKDLADNYLEMAKQRLYHPEHPQHAGACFTLRALLLDMLKLLAPFLPYITETLYQELFAAAEGVHSIHVSRWPVPVPTFEDQAVLALGETLVTAATAVRRFKSEQNLSLGAELSRLQLIAASPELGAALEAASADLMSVTRALAVELVPEFAPEAIPVVCESADLEIGIVALLAD